MRKLSANYIFPITSEPLKYGIIEIEDDGTIIDIIDTKGKLYEADKIEYYSGILVPGFINTHCHLELSYLKGEINPGGKLKSFIIQIVDKYRNLQISEQQKIEKAKLWDKIMFEKGIVAVGDISNKEFSAQVKNQSSIFYYTFLEAIDDFDQNRWKQNLEYLMQIKSKFNRATLVPHAPYDVFLENIKFLSELADFEDTISIHNQETEGENQLFLEKKGDILEIFEKLNLDGLKNFEPTGKTSLQSYLPYMNNHHKTLLVHNIYTTEADLNFIEKSQKDIYFAFCPKSNLYIENRLPDFHKFEKFWNRCTVGTDSLASNDTLDILEELKLIDVPFKEKIKWATINGAKALGFEKMLGSFEKGKKPGINLITNFDFQKFDLTDKSEVKKLI